MAESPCVAGGANYVPQEHDREGVAERMLRSEGIRRPGRTPLLLSCAEAWWACA